MSSKRWHVNARALRMGDRTQPIGAIIAAEDAPHAMAWLLRAVEHQSFANPDLVPLRDLDGISWTVERTDEGAS